MQRNKKVWSIYRKKKLKEPDHSKALGGDTSILHFQNRITIHKINEDIKDMNNPVNRLELTDTYIGHSTEQEQNTQLFSSTHRNSLYKTDPQTTVKPQNMFQYIKRLNHTKYHFDSGDYLKS